MASYPFPDLPLDLTENINDRDEQLPPTPHFSRPFAAPPMSQYATSSPAQNNASTPAESVLSIHYQSSNHSDLAPDEATDQLFNEFFSVAGTAHLDGNAPPFLGPNADFDLFGPADPLAATAVNTTYTTPEPIFNTYTHAPVHPHSQSHLHTHSFTYASTGDFKPTYPISPDQTPSLNGPSSPDNLPGSVLTTPGYKFASRDISAVSSFEGLVSPEQLTKSALDISGTVPFPNLQAVVVNGISAAQLTPDNTSSGGSLGNNDNRSLSTDGGAITTTTSPMANMNPHVTVSLYGRESGQHEDSSYLSSGKTKTEGTDSNDGRRGISPSGRPSTELATTVNEDAEARQVETQNMAVSNWLSTADDRAADPVPDSAFVGVSDREIALGHETENVEQPGRTYFTGGSGEATETDYQLMLKSSSAWGSGPSVLRIQNIQQGGERHQPQTSQAAIDRFEKMYRDNASMLSRAATWGTRRRSLPSIAPSVADMEGVTSGNFLKKLSLSRDPHSRRPSILGGLRDLVRKNSSSQQNKRSRAAPDDEAPEGDSSTYAAEDPRRDSTNSRGKNKQATPSINAALISMGNNMASIGVTHTSRSGSVSQPGAGNPLSPSPPLTSPKSPLLKVSSSIRRPRSRSDARGVVPDNTQSNLISMLMKTGGLPVASLARPFGPVHSSSSSTVMPAPIKIPATHTAVIDPDEEDDDDEDDDDENFDDGDLAAGSNELIDKINPDFDGFKELVLGLNPQLAAGNTYLVDRIAHQQIVRYKGLLNSKIRHLGKVSVGACANGTKCIGQGGVAVLCDSKGKPRSLDASLLSTATTTKRYEGDDVADDLASPLDGAISSESFPKYIPLPPTSSLPAQFECQLCFQTKRPKKPSDWTKHVHEDVQPFTCTWDRCRDPKMFKRKADWVRHENEGHRHLEWWTCDVDECRHTCYRRDNFLQHLVREHKFPKPMNKTKAAIKQGGALEPTWQHVELCRFETDKRPQEEPCRFCDKTFPTWKKLTVHLAKHMEHISLPILRLVERKDVDPDTLISPVPDPPPRTFVPMPTFPPAAPGDDLRHSGSDFSGYYVHPGMGQPPMGQPPMGYNHPPVGFDHPRYDQPPGAQPQDPNTYIYQPVVTQDMPYAPVYYPQPPPPPPTQFGYLDPSANQYVGNDVGFHTPFSSANALGLQTPLVGGGMHYDGPMDASGEHYTPQGSVTHGSVSPFGHSPHLAQGQYFP